MSRISDTIKQDHREIESYYKVILSAQDSDEQTRYQNMLTWELARHSVGEELVLHPAMEKYLRDGSEATEKDRQEHQKVRLSLTKQFPIEDS
jgi:hemerythrin superfamily protein